MTLDDIGRLKLMARERIEVGRRALAAELGISMPAQSSMVTAEADRLEQPAVG
jgi:hypothetical protein